MSQIFIGIRREDKSVWERRVTLIPQHVHEILQSCKDLKFIIQPCNKRIFSDFEYEQVGAILSDDLSKCTLILGVKEIPIPEYKANTTYMNFAHIIKAQEANMETLDHLLKNKIRHIDYEKIIDENGNRLVAFGKFAGIAGAIDFLGGLGLFILKMGYSTTLLNIPPSYKYFDLQSAYKHIAKNGRRLAKELIPEVLRPLIFAITGKGRCSMGCYEVLKNLPHKVVDPDELQALCQNPTDPSHKSQIYVTFIESQHMVQHQTSIKFSKQDYYKHPENYVSIFSDRYLPYISAIFHNMYWDYRFPRLITEKQMKDLVESGKSRLLGIGDVTCDFNGSIEWLKHFTNPDKPFWVYNPIKQEVIHDVVYPEKGCILYDSFDYLPCELAYDASVHFSSILKAWIPNIARSDISKPLNQQQLIPCIERAVITWNGQYTDNYKYIKTLRLQKEIQKNDKQQPNLVAVKNFQVLKVSGKLFGEAGINKILDLCTKFKTHFKVIQMKAGTDDENDEESYMILQIGSYDKKDLDQVMQEILEIGNSQNMEIKDLIQEVKPKI